MKTKWNEVILTLCLLTSVLIMNGCTQKNEIHQSSAAKSSSSESSSSEVLQDDTLTLSDVLTLKDISIVSLEIYYRNIVEETVTTLSGESADTVSQEILNWEIEPFDKKKYDPVNGGDKKYVIKTSEGVSYEIIEDGSVTINAQDQYLLINRDYSLSIPKDTIWEIRKK